MQGFGSQGFTGWTGATGPLGVSGIPGSSHYTIITSTVVVVRIPEATRRETWGWVNFQLKMQGFMHFYCEKHLVGGNRDRGGGLIDPVGV